MDDGNKSAGITINDCSTQTAGFPTERTVDADAMTLVQLRCVGLMVPKADAVGRPPEGDGTYSGRDNQKLTLML
jgi:hypothetical protein